MGGAGIGAKTSLISRIVFNKDSCEFNLNNYSKIIELKKGHKIKLDLWDTEGQERYRSLIKIFIPDTNCIVLGFDITNKSSFDEIKEFYLPYVKNNSNIKLIYLIGNKIDLYEERQVSKKEAIDFSKKNNLRYFETSCNIGYGIKNFMEDLSNEIIKT